MFINRWHTVALNCVFQRPSYELKESLLYLLFSALSFVYSCVTTVETDVIVDLGGNLN